MLIFVYTETIFNASNARGWRKPAPDPLGTLDFRRLGLSPDRCPDKCNRKGILKARLPFNQMKTTRERDTQIRFLLL